MRDSINYNLKYFIMKMSGTKPMKNTMRKPSPIKFFQPVTVGKDAVKRVSDAAKAAAARAKKAAATNNPAGSKTSGAEVAPRGPLARAKAKAAISSRTTKQSPLKFILTDRVMEHNKKYRESLEAIGTSTSAKARNEAKKAAYLKGKKSATTETASEAKARQEKVKAERALSKTDRATAAKAKMDKYKSGSKSTTSTETSTKEATPKPTPAGKPASSTETSVKSTTPTNKANTSTAETSVKSPAMQLKKASMKKAAMKKKY